MKKENIPIYVYIYIYAENPLKKRFHNTYRLILLLKDLRMSRFLYKEKTGGGDRYRSSNLLILSLRSIYNNRIECNKMNIKKRMRVFSSRKDHNSRLLFHSEQLSLCT